MSKRFEIDGVEVDLDDGVDPADLDQGSDSRDDSVIDWDQVEADAADASGEVDD
ncbi:hypothetical protein [Ruania halotolerans]|uniref:hypothetical protein n=1 Tax=Ruania halotolerans TaxID=2897773 RepID=UPI001E3F46D3|nr:hypothetical protein [Ruania halotolerans]UFU05487.1 hypothetical protein LQF10_13660 [Ruania halotolerans]